MAKEFAISKVQVARLSALRSVLTELQAELSLAHLVALLTVTLEPGLSVNELAERMGLPQQAASRCASVLLGRYEGFSTAKHKEPLLTQLVSSSDARKRALFLTQRGRDLVAILAALDLRGMKLKRGKNVSG